MRKLKAPVRLNLGCSDKLLEGYINVDRRKIPGARRMEAYPLKFPESYADEIRASHLLEHFPYHVPPGGKESLGVLVLRDWARVLKPGGVLKVAVPDFEKICLAYGDDRKEWNIEGFLFGGQSNGDDYHQSVWDRGKLAAALEAAGLVNVREWKTEHPDCAALPVSLNLQATKPSSQASAQPAPAGPKFKVAAVMSVPRLGFMDNFFSAFAALTPLGISLRRTQGAFWGQCMERGMMEALALEAPDAILTLDYDTVFTRADVTALITLIMTHPEADAIAALQAARHKKYPLMTVKGPDGLNIVAFDRNEFAVPLFKCATAHFGLTLLRTSALRDIPHPWFCPKTAADGTWSEGRTDDDIWLWRQWEMAHKTLFVAPRVVIGHVEAMIMWPGPDLDAIFQYSGEWQREGKPEGAWK